MKRFILSASLVLLGVATLAPVALASSQASTPRQLSDGATITDLVRHNRDVRSK